MSLFVIFYLGLRSCKHLLRGNKELKGSGLWQVLCIKKFLLASSLNKGVSYSKKLHHLAAERTFVLEMRKKYADGQAIAKKLNKELTKITASVKLLIPQLKALRTAQFGDLSGDEVFAIVKDTQSPIYS
ncbi:uncharacterized protein LOC111347095 [Stylophora pistillata]|uniref:uncharacterized protein LOC111347095 n=1 Tax=Stylophora pistillata TaxID=50429 RepID=UPI000C046F6C|nr:uncharacterized protein LOC111347095 [Stylophora pistillata]